LPVVCFTDVGADEEEQEEQEMEHEEEEEEEEELKLEQEEEEEHGAKRLFNPFTSIASPETMKKETSS